MKFISYLVGLYALLLLASGCARQASADLAPGQTASGTAIGQGIDRYHNMFEVRLDGANEGVLAEVFGKVVVSAPTVLSATRYSSRIMPDSPQECWIIWRVKVEENGNSFRLQTDMMEMFNEISAAGGYIDLYGVPYRYNASEIALLKGIRPGDATSRALQFVVDRELARDREMAGQ